MSGPKKKVKTSFFKEAGAEELPTKPVNVELVQIEAPAPTPVAVEPDLDAGRDFVPLEPEVEEKAEAVEEPEHIEELVGATAMVVEPQADLRLVNEELQVYQGSLTLYLIVACLSINLFTQGIKLITKYPLHEKKPPFKVGAIVIGGWSEGGFSWFMKLWPFVFSIPVSIYAVNPVMSALGFPGEFTWWQSLWFAPFFGGGSIGVWAILPQSLKDFLNREQKDESSGLVSDSEVTRKVKEALAGLDWADEELKDAMMAAAEEHSSAVDVFDAETLED